MSRELDKPLDEGKLLIIRGDLPPGNFALLKRVGPTRKSRGNWVARVALVPRQAHVEEFDLFMCAEKHKGNGNVVVINYIN